MNAKEIKSERGPNQPVNIMEFKGHPMIDQDSGMVLNQFTPRGEAYTRAVRWLTDPDISPAYFDHGGVPSEAEIMVGLTRGFISHEEAVFEIFVGDGTPVGHVLAHSIDVKKRSGYVGVFVGEKQYWGKGVGTRSLDILLWRMKSIGFLDVLFDIHETNERSHGMMRSLHAVQSQYNRFPGSHSFLLHLPIWSPPVDMNPMVIQH